MTSQPDQQQEPLSDLCEVWQEVRGKAKTRWVHINGLSSVPGRELLETFYGQLASGDHSNVWPNQPAVSPFDRTPPISAHAPVSWFWWAIPGVFRSPEAPDSWWPASSLPYALAAATENLSSIALARINLDAPDAAAASLIQNCLSAIASARRRNEFLSSWQAVHPFFRSSRSEQLIDADWDYLLTWRTRCSSLLRALMARCVNSQVIPTILVIDQIDAADALILEFLQDALIEAIGLRWPLLLISTGELGSELSETANLREGKNESAKDLVNAMTHRFPSFRTEHFSLLQPGPVETELTRLPLQETAYSLINHIRNGTRLAKEGSVSVVLHEVARSFWDSDDGTAERLFEVEHERCVSAKTWIKGEQEWSGAIRELSLRRQLHCLPAEELERIAIPNCITGSASKQLDYLVALQLGNNHQATEQLAAFLVYQSSSVTEVWCKTDRARLLIVYARSLAELGKLSDASERFAQSIEILTEETDALHLVMLIRTLEALGGLQIEQSEPARALDCVESAQAVCQDLLKDFGRLRILLEISLSLKHLATTAWLKLGEPRKAEQVLDSAEIDFSALEETTGLTRVLIDLRAQNFRLKIALSATTPESNPGISEQLVTFRRELVDRFGRSRSNLEQLAEALCLHADHLFLSESFPEARVAYNEAISLRSSLVEIYGSDVESLLAGGMTLLATAQFNLYAGEEQSAEQLASDASCVLRQIGPEMLDCRLIHPVLANAMIDIAVLLMEFDRQRRSEAESLLSEAIKVVDKWPAGLSNESVAIRAIPRLRASAVFYRAGDLSSAIHIAEEAYQSLSDPVVQEDGYLEMMRTEVELNLGRLWAESGDRGLARKFLQKAFTRSLHFASDLKSSITELELLYQIIHSYLELVQFLPQNEKRICSESHDLMLTAFESSTKRFIELAKGDLVRLKQIEEIRDLFEKTSLDYSPGRSPRIQSDSRTRVAQRDELIDNSRRVLPS
jgi:tetratricopeptide (TPR) repeat protein